MRMSLPPCFSPLSYLCSLHTFAAHRDSSSLSFLQIIRRRQIPEAWFPTSRRRPARQWANHFPDPTHQYPATHFEASHIKHDISFLVSAEYCAFSWPLLAPEMKLLNPMLQRELTALRRVLWRLGVGSLHFQPFPRYGCGRLYCEPEILQRGTPWHSATN